jgi:hypothetical protein
MALFTLNWDKRKYTDGWRNEVIESIIRYMTNASRSIDVKMCWNQALYADTELRNRVENYRQRELSMDQAVVEDQKRKLKILEMLKDSEPDWEAIRKLELAARSHLAY